MLPDPWTTPPPCPYPPQPRTDAPADLGYLRRYFQSSPPPLSKQLDGSLAGSGSVESASVDAASDCAASSDCGSAADSAVDAPLPSPANPLNGQAAGTANSATNGAAQGLPSYHALQQRCWQLPGWAHYRSRSLEMNLMGSGGCNAVSQGLCLVYHHVLGQSGNEPHGIRWVQRFLVDRATLAKG